ncbi:MAG: FAD binding domain-containing protein [Bacillota bacterium]
MYSIRQYVFPESLAEAYRLLQADSGNTIIGGGAYLRLSNKIIETAIDISRLDLDFIREETDSIEIGAMTTFREIETSPLLKKYFSGILPESVKDIVGVQLRNIVTAGATVYARFGFSDFITALLALDVEVELYHAGRMPLEKFLKEGAPRDILVKLVIKNTAGKASFQAMRNSYGDYAILNAAVSKLGDHWKIVVGARPGRGEIAREASKYLEQCGLTPEEIEEAARMAAKELTFGSNIRGSREYREAICPVLIKRAVQEVLAWK